MHENEDSDSDSSEVSWISRWWSSWAFDYFSQNQEEIDDYFYGEIEEDILPDLDHVMHRKSSQELNEEAKNVLRHVN